MIAIGDRVPSVTVKRVTADGAEDIDTAAWFGKGITAFFAVPGAFTPTCHFNHLPGYVAKADEILAAGADRIVCASVNDHHVMRAWGEATNAFPKIEMLSDFDARFARAIGLDKDLSQGGLGLRFRRSSALIIDGVFENITLEEGTGGYLTTGADSMLVQLERANCRENA
ncbi:peroxiredoxin [Cucumibacter marinus]|uniref:peroxiredoxin n=1 Tax=Cucumibacter marinus TaxID=1121252 RepID=UPI00048C6BCD|nr:peroxiredoxin [Cucumibacter marinus]